jgi:hypothetical protein
MGVCMTSCIDDAQCEAGARCVNGLCITERPSANIMGVTTAVCSEAILVSGAGSTDPNGLPLSYVWRQTAGPNAIGSAPTDEETLGIVMPRVDVETTLRFELIVHNGAFVSDPAFWDIQLEACPSALDEGEEHDMGDFGQMDATTFDSGDTATDLDRGLDIDPSPDMRVDDADLSTDTGMDTGIDTGVDQENPDVLVPDDGTQPDTASTRRGDLKGGAIFCAHPPAGFPSKGTHTVWILILICLWRSARCSKSRTS